MSFFCCSFGFRFSLRDTLSTSTAVFNFNIHFRAGGSDRPFGTATNEDTHLIWWYRLGRQSAYLRHISFLVNGNRLSPEPASRFCKFHNFCTAVAICQLISSSMDFGDSFFAFILGSFHQPIPVRYNWSVFARKMHSTSEFAMIVIHAGFVTVAWTLRGIPFQVGGWILDLISEFRIAATRDPLVSISQPHHVQHEWWISRVWPGLYLLLKMGVTQ